MDQSLSSFFRSESLPKSIVRNVFGISFALIFGAFAQIGHSQTANPADAPPLELGVPVEGAIAAKEKRTYQITLAENQYAVVTVEQRGIDVAVRVFNKTDERAMTQRDLVANTDGRETVAFTASEAGVYRLEIEAKMLPAVTGKFTVRLAEVRPPTDRELRLEEARKLHNQSFKLWRAGKFAEAIPVAERALAIREAESGTEDLDVAASLVSLALVINESGDYEKGIALIERSLKIREKILGRDHLELVVSLGNLGEIYRVLGNFGKAEQLQRRALEIKEKNLPPDDAGIASSLSNLAVVCLDKGDWNKALELELRAVDIWEKASGSEHPNTARGLQIAGNAYSEKGDYQSAEIYYRRALNIFQKAYGPEHPRTSDAMGNLAVLYTKKGDYRQAEPLFRQTLAVIEKTLGKDHRNYAIALNYLAVLYTDTGEYQKAEPLYRQAIAVSEKLFGSQHPLVVLYLDNLARNYQAQGKTAESVEVLTRAHQLSERNIRLTLSTNSERQKLLYLNRLSGETNQYISQHLNFAPDDPAALELALTTLLERKGRVADAMASDFAVLRNHFDQDDQMLLDKLKDATNQLARKILDESPNGKPEEYQKQIKDLEERKENLEIEISRRSAEFRSQIQPVTIASIRAAIPENAALIEFGIYRPYNPKVIDSKAYGEPRYAAYVLRRTGKIEWKDLGAARAIDDSIHNFRQALSDPNREDAKRLARAVDEKVMQPLRELTENAAQLLISPDGALNLIPFEALTDERNRFLIENYSFTYLTGGRDLLRLQTVRESKNKSLVIANPSFGEPLAAPVAKVNFTGAAKRPIIAARDLADTYFTPLGGTAQEARSIQAIFPDAGFLTANQATETALKQTVAPRILHIATHGFFLEDTDLNDAAKTGKRGGSDTETNDANPLLRSGLALAGANRRDGAGDDGILTALEASGLNLWGTKLVVLSACDTGLGEVKNGEGVYGLRRAFVLAGTESMVMSLWSVSDQVTRELMTNYYKNLKAGMGRGAALRAVQLEMLKKSNRRHPFYWAAFIQSGEWANLDGKR